MTPTDFLAAMARGGRYGYDCGGRELRGGAMLALVAVLLLALAIGFALGYGFREIISRRRRVAARAAADEERHRELDGDQTLPHLE